MTLLNRASDGLASVLVAVFRALSETGPIDRDELVSLLGPGSLGNDDQKIRNTILRWEQLGFFIETDSKIAINPKYSGIPHKYTDQPTLSDFRRTTLDIVIEAGSNDENRLVDDAIVGTWWLLTVDPFSDVIRSWPDAERILARDFPRNVVIQNDTRWPGLMEWAHLWGLVQPPSAGSALIPCPAEAIGWHLPELLAHGSNVPVKTFLIELNRKLPLIPLLVDGPSEGALAKKLPTRSRSHAEGSAKLSMSLSLALNTLREMGRIGFRNFDTAEKWFLSDDEGRAISHLVREQP